MIHWQHIKATNMTYAYYTLCLVLIRLIDALTYQLLILQEVVLVE